MSAPHRNDPDYRRKEPRDGYVGGLDKEVLDGFGKGNPKAKALKKKMGKK